MRDEVTPGLRWWTLRRTGVRFAGYVGVVALAVGLAGCDETPTTVLAPGLPGVAPASRADGFQVDPYWPRPLPEGWLLGNVVGVATDSSDNVWIIHRPGSQAGAGETPPVIAFDPSGNVVQSWGGPGDGYDWGTQTHGIHVDRQDNVWVGFGGGLPVDPDPVVAGYLDHPDGAVADSISRQCVDERMDVSRRDVGRLGRLLCDGRRCQQRHDQCEHESEHDGLLERQ